jgi:hypothetical protein
MTTTEVLIAVGGLFVGMWLMLLAVEKDDDDFKH